MSGHARHNPSPRDARSRLRATRGGLLQTCSCPLLLVSSGLMGPYMGTPIRYVQGGGGDRCKPDRRKPGPCRTAEGPAWHAKGDAAAERHALFLASLSSSSTVACGTTIPSLPRLPPKPAATIERACRPSLEPPAASVHASTSKCRLHPRQWDSDVRCKGRETPGCASLAACAGPSCQPFDPDSRLHPSITSLTPPPIVKDLVSRHSKPQTPSKRRRRKTASWGRKLRHHSHMPIAPLSCALTYSSDYRFVFVHVVRSSDRYVLLSTLKAHTPSSDAVICHIRWPASMTAADRRLSSSLPLVSSTHHEPCITQPIELETA